MSSSPKLKGFTEYISTIGKSDKNMDIAIQRTKILCGKNNCYFLPFKIDLSSFYYNKCKSPINWFNDFNVKFLHDIYEIEESGKNYCFCVYKMNLDGQGKFVDLFQTLHSLKYELSMASQNFYMQFPLKIKKL